MNMTRRAVLSFAFMQVGWFACVLGAARGYPWLGPAVVFVGLAIQVRTQSRGARASRAVWMGTITPNEITKALATSFPFRRVGRQ
jgi:hypothetical protein